MKCIISHVIIIFISYNRSNLWKNVMRRVWTRRYIQPCIIRKFLFRYCGAIRIGYRSVWNTCPIYMCEIFRLTPPKVTPLTISLLDVLSPHIRYILYTPYYGQSEPANANIRISHIGFMIFMMGFITRSRCARTSAVTAEYQPLLVWARC